MFYPLKKFDLGEKFIMTIELSKKTSLTASMIYVSKTSAVGKIVIAIIKQATSILNRASPPLPVFQFSLFSQLVKNKTECSKRQNAANYKTANDCTYEATQESRKHEGYKYSNAQLAVEFFLKLVNLKSFIWQVQISSFDCIRMYLRICFHLIFPYL